MSCVRKHHRSAMVGALLIGAPLYTAVAAAPATALRTAADDPLVRYQWHISNQGQQVIGDIRPVAGVDMDVDVLHSLGIRGKGIRVGVVDDGLELGHEDLADNIIPNGSYNFETGSHDVTPIDPFLSHGTAVAGIVAAVGWNGRGGRGVAPEARLCGVRFRRPRLVQEPGQRALCLGRWAGRSKHRYLQQQLGPAGLVLPGFSATGASVMGGIDALDPRRTGSGLRQDRG